ncbi:MAG: glycosyltransferase [Flavobacterium sp.]|nr:glycosyltransferase [Flavobacterium sp.]
MSNHKQEILFVVNNLNCGGAEKALISLLQTFDYSRYNVDLLLFKQEGLFLNQIPEQVTLLSEPDRYKYFDMPIKKAIVENLKKFNFNTIINRIGAAFVFKNETINAVVEQKMWKYLRNSMSKLPKKYDVAIGFLEKTPNYFVVDKVDAKIKIGFIMNDYNKLQMDKTIDARYFSKLDFIAQDSQESNTILVQNFPEFKDKFKIIKSIIASKTIRKLADEVVHDIPTGFNIVSVGRLSYQKGYDLALDALKIIHSKGILFHWIILGVGEEENNLKAKVIEYGLHDKIKFVGIKENHYPYLKKADIFLHTARFEGFGIVIQEAKILTKPIVLTDFNVAKSHIEHGKNGLIASMNPESIAENLEMLISDLNLRNQFSAELNKYDFGTENEIENFYNLLIKS